MKRNYQRELDQIIEKQQSADQVPTLLLHSCCGPCSTYVLEYLSHYFHITLFYYNPNIYPPEEYTRRAQEQRQLLSWLPQVHPIRFMEGTYRPEDFYTAVKGLETLPEGDRRCFTCYELRLKQAAAMAKELGMDYFTTTLSISPHKNAEKLNEIGEAVAANYDINYLPSDFKKKGGYQRSITLSREYGLYRQDYCGCIFSKNQRESGKQSETGGIDDVN